MTDLLIRPEDSGEIPLADPGEDTRNLAPYALKPPPLHALRLADCAATITGELAWGGGFGMGLVWDPTPPFPPPPPPPIPAVDDRPLSAGDEAAWRQEWRRPERKPLSFWGRLTYRGTHRRSGR